MLILHRNRSMAKPIALLLFFTTILTRILSNASQNVSLMSPLNCSGNPIHTCNSYLYHISKGLKIEEIAFFYSVNTAQVMPINKGSKQDYLISVPCDCEATNGTVGYFYDSIYRVKSGDTPISVTDQIYSGQVWEIGGSETFNPRDVIPIHLLCGCLGENSQVVVTYTVQQGDTLTDIAVLLSSSLDGILRLNGRLTQNPGVIDIGLVLFVPAQKKGIIQVTSKDGKGNKILIIISILASIAILAVVAMIVFFYWRHKSRKITPGKPKSVTNPSAKNMASFTNQYLPGENMEDMTAFESERPVVFSLEEIEEATGNFDKTRIIGEGGYGSVYFGMLREQEVAIKKMKSNKCKEFFAELKVLCKVHHINVVELIGFASGDDHLYLVYEYVKNGSLSDHLHDPLLKGNQPLSWNARAQIALDAARGIEYIHDHTKARYVHRDIKTSNILLDEGLRAKVADFGLAKLVERSGEEDYIATRLVGTPGYLPPESVSELQMTSKTDVFAFGVVLAELITGQRALIRDNREPGKLKSLITTVYATFCQEDSGNPLEAIIDSNLKDSYPMEEVHKMAEISAWCLSKDAINRPEMQEIVVKLSQIVMSSIQWEASLGGSSQIFSGVLNGR
ncbi:lysM domain receptor-like kinase 3 [Tasmannia lanceolata]|uniref:lysM domain receptor-like kinase 3 n=1 Tax=Tasmannia lanceolata TaxID=3420 RepID=UPI00406307F9